MSDSKILDGGALQAALAEQQRAAFEADQERIKAGPNRNVGGVFVALTPEEIAAHEADQAAAKAAEAARPKPVTLADLAARIAELEARK